MARVDLEAEAIRLARLLAGLMPDEPETLSLLALLLLTSARTSARADADGNPVTLADQDRARWNRAAIAEGSAWLSEAVDRSGGVAGAYQLQAHLAAAHSTALSWQETDWDRIVGLYDLLGSITANPVVALNRAVAVTERDGPEVGLAALKTIAGLEDSHLWHAALADNLCRLGLTNEAAAELHTAVTLAPSDGTAPPAGPAARCAIRARLTGLSSCPGFPAASHARPGRTTTRGSVAYGTRMSAVRRVDGDKPCTGRPTVPPMSTA